MFTRTIFTLIAAGVLASPGFAQLPWQFHWQKGQKLTYQVKHTTEVTETIGKDVVSSRSNLDLTKRWHVTDADNQGSATVSLVLVAMRNEQTRPDGKTLLFDSKNLDKSTPELKDQMGRFIGQTLAVVRVDVYGRVLEVKQGQASRYEAEPPFHVVFPPEAKAAVGQAWRRQYNLVMDPPLGAGEKHEAEQRYECKGIKGNMATLALTTSFKTLPESVRERLPLLQKDVQGLIQFDLKGGRMLATVLTIDKTVENHQGAGSSYRFQSKYTEELVPE